MAYRLKLLHLRLKILWLKLYLFVNLIAIKVIRLALAVVDGKEGS